MSVKHGFSFTRSQATKLKKVADGKLESAKLLLSPEQLEGDNMVKLTKAMKKQVVEHQTAGKKISIVFDKPMLGSGWAAVAEVAVPIVQEVLKDEGTDRLLERLSVLRGSGVSDDAWQSFADGFKFVFTNPQEALDLLTLEGKNLLTGAKQSESKSYRLPVGVDYKPGMDYKKVGTRIK